MSKLETTIIFGTHSVKSFIVKSPDKIKTIYYLRSYQNNKIDEIIDLSKKLNIQIIPCEKKELNKIASNNNHQGLIAKIHFQQSLDIDKINEKFFLKQHSSILILDSIQDPRNLGACLRNALAFDVDAVIINKDNSAPINEHVFKSSVGAILGLNIFRVTNLSMTIEKLKKMGFWIIGLDNQKSQNIYSEKFPDKTAFVLGSEGQGIRRLVKKNCDQLLEIPISKEIDSLNISVATGIVLYEFKKQHFN